MSAPTRDTIFALVGLATFVYTVLGRVPANIAPTVVMIAGALCGLPIFAASFKKNGNDK
jgi:hypothetical protein